jgi:hypothetical protein
MDFIDFIKDLQKKIEKLKPPPETEEATKTALIMPFIQILGYDVFNPNEVVPEFTADVGHKKGEKVDYAIMIDSKPIILFECKTFGTDLSIEHMSQLFRYFTTQNSVRFGILTNGVQYRFYCDLDNPNKMDEKPFFELNLNSFNESHIQELKRFTKSAFNLEDIVSAAGELKYTREVKRIIAEQINDPSADFIRFFAAQIYPGKLMQSVMEKFHGIIKYALQQFINEKVNERLKSALNQTEKTEEPKIQEVSETADSDNADINTTEEEKEAYFIVKAILNGFVEPQKITMRDKKSFCSILYEDNNRKPICKFFFNNSSDLCLGFFDEKKEMTKIQISSIDDLYKYADVLRNTVSNYLPRDSEEEK